MRFALLEVDVVFGETCESVNPFPADGERGPSRASGVDVGANLRGLVILLLSGDVGVEQNCFGASVRERRGLDGFREVRKRRNAEHRCSTSNRACILARA